MARLNFITTIEPAAGESLAYAERPQWFKDWENTGLLAFEDKNNDGKIQYSANVSDNEMVKVDRDIMVLANPAIANLPNWVIALVAAGGLASLIYSSRSIAGNIFFHIT
jgi:cation/acetate symporter